MTTLNDLLIGVLAVDSYKIGHPNLYNQKTSQMQGNIVPRNTKYFTNASKYYDNSVVVAGVQGAIKQMHLMWEKFFNSSWGKIKDILDLIVPSMTGSHDYSKFKKLHELGYLPVLIHSVPEGASVKVGNAFLTVDSTHHDFAWITIYVETQLLNMLWYPCTIATTIREYRRVVEKEAERTCDNKHHITWQVHNFSLRGLQGLGGTSIGPAHLMYFSGTDDVINCLQVVADYDATPNQYGSVLATEHSVATSNIQYIAETQNVSLLEAEKIWMKQILTDNPNGILSYVIDSYDAWGVVGKVVPELKELITSRDGKLVLRPDSGDPVEAVAGKLNRNLLHPTIEDKGIIEHLWDVFGGKINFKGYKELDSHIGVILGDGVNISRMQEIFDRLEAKGFAANNIVFGIGAYTMTGVTRDTFGMAMKATFAVIAGEFVDVYKDPLTDPGKKSLKGFVTLHEGEDGVWYSKDQQAPDVFVDWRKKVYFNGVVKNTVSLFDLRKRAEKFL